MCSRHTSNSSSALERGNKRERARERERESERETRMAGQAFLAAPKRDMIQFFDFSEAFEAVL